VAPINDLAFFARLSPEGRRGFLVLCGGGTATLVRSGKVLHQFLPAGDLLLLSEAVLRVFHREGERKNKHKARLKWLIERIGFDEFARRVHAELATFSDAERQAAQLGFHPDAPPELPAPPPPRQAPELPLAVEEVGYAEWCADNVAPQRQPGYVAVQLRLPLGDLYPQQLDGLAALCERLGEGQVRTTTEQNVVLRFIPAGRTRALYHELRALGLHAGGAGFIGDVTSCPGADTCAIAVTASRGIGRELTEHLFARRDKQPGDPESLRDESSLLKTRIRVSGCPNGCGQHHVADIGFQGALRKVGGRALPAYHLYIGGGGDVRQAAAGKDGATAAPTARFGRVVGRLPARRGKAAVDRLIALWRRTRQGDETLSAFLAEVPLDTVQKELADLLVITEETAQPDDYVDLGQSAPFSVSDAEGECAA
jgi:sulfite reductase beta subunit-like hemoprotein